MAAVQLVLAGQGHACDIILVVAGAGRSERDAEPEVDDAGDAGGSSDEDYGEDDEALPRPLPDEEAPEGMPAHIPAFQASVIKIWGAFAMYFFGQQLDHLQQGHPI